MTFFYLFISSLRNLVVIYLYTFIYLFFFFFGVKHGVCLDNRCLTLLPNFV